MEYDDGFSLDLGQLVVVPPLRYKPSFVSPLAARFAPMSVKPDFMSAMDTHTTRRLQGQTAAALAGSSAWFYEGLGDQRAMPVRYKAGSTSPIAIRSAPWSNKPDFVSPLDTGGARSTRFLQTRTSAGLASLFNQFDPSVPVTASADSALKAARRQAGIEEQPDETGMEMTAENGDEIIIDDPLAPKVCEETTFTNADCTMKVLPIVGGIALAAVVIGMMLRD